MRGCGCDGPDLNYLEDSGGGPDLTVGLFPKLDKVSLLQVNDFVFLKTFLQFILDRGLNVLPAG